MDADAHAKQLHFTSQTDSLISIIQFYFLNWQVIWPFHSVLSAIGIKFMQTRETELHDLFFWT